MNILFLCHRLPYPPTRGGKIRPFNIIRHLNSAGHEITVGSLARSRAELDEGKDLGQYCKKVLTGEIGTASAITQMIARLPTSSPSSMGYFYSRSLHQQIKRETVSQKFDLVFVHCSSAAQYARHVTNAISILDFGDMDSQKWLDYSSYRMFPLSMGYWLEGAKLLREEKRLANRFDVCTATTQLELATLNTLGAACKTGWFPNGVDADFFRPLSTGSSFDEKKICFVGRMDYFPNQQAMYWFCKNVLPILKSRVPGVRLEIIGAEPSDRIRELAKIAGVKVTGTVPDVREYVKSSALSVAPLAIARGTQNKILESLAMGVPVVCSSLAAGGVDARPGVDLVVADGVENTATAICNILTSKEERRRLSDAGRSRVLSNHNWEKSMGKLDEIVEMACEFRNRNIAGRVAA